MRVRLEMKKYNNQEERTSLKSGEVMLQKDRSKIKLKVNAVSIVMEEHKRPTERCRRRSSSGIMFKAMNSKTAWTKEQKNSEFKPTDPLEYGCRKLVMEGLVQIYQGSKIKERCIFLYNDLFVIAKEKSHDKYTLKEYVKLCDMWLDLGSVPQVLPNFSCLHHLSFVLGWPASENLAAIFTNKNIRDIWYQVLQNHISVARDKEKTSLPIKIALQGPSYSMIKSLMVSNKETTNNLIERCINEFRLQPRSSSDFQLHISSEADEDSIPLLGFENPFSVYTNLLRNAKCNSLMTFLPEIKLFLKSKHKPKSSNDKCNTKNKIALLKRMLSRGNSIGKLFGRDLSELTDQNEFCPTLMKILGEIYIHGPTCTGIFRRSASPAMRNLRSQLDSGDEGVLNDMCNIHDVAALLKEFLRSMPDCLLTSSLYHEWVKIATISNKDSSNEQIKRLIHILPQSHVTLLKYLLCVLNSVAQFSDQNLMTAYNLAVCISQCILWSEENVTQSSLPNISSISSFPSCSSLEQFNDIAKINVLVQYLIEHTSEIFGEDCLMLLDHLSLSRNSALATFTSQKSTESDNWVTAIEGNNSPAYSFLKSGTPKLRVFHSKKGMYASTPMLTTVDMS